MFSAAFVPLPSQALIIGLCIGLGVPLIAVLVAYRMYLKKKGPWAPGGRWGGPKLPADEKLDPEDKGDKVV